MRAGSPRACSHTPVDRATTMAPLARSPIQSYADHDTDDRGQGQA
jgi:hypothetical protein